MKYERLTERRGKYIALKGKDFHMDEEYTILKNRLAKLEDKIERGELVELPCKVGDEIYIVSKLGIEEFAVKAISFTILDHDCWGTNYIQFVDKNGHRKFNYQVYFSEIGKTVFLTKAEAEAKLKEKELEK
jgi:hypothetical protein